MGFIKAFTGALGGSFADQWLDYYGPKPISSPTVAVFQAVPQGPNAGRGENTKGSENIISNGSKILVPEGTALVTLQDGQITGVIAEAGGYEYKSDDPNAQSLFAGNLGAPFVQTWERFKFGGQPASQQLAFYVNLKEIHGNRFGTQSEIYWDDAYLNAQVGAITRGTYTIKIADPVLFLKNFVPQMYLQPNAKEFDFQDMDNTAASQLFSEVVGSLAAAFSKYTNDPSKGNRITKIQSDAEGFATALGAAVEESHQWRSRCGIEIVAQGTSVEAIEYDEDSKALLSDVKKADALSGARGNAFMQQSVARGMQAMGENGNAAGMAFMGMGMNAAGGMMQGVSQPQEATANPYINVGQAQPQAPAQEDPYAKLAEMKKLLDAGVITQEDFDKAKSQLLGI